MSGYLNDEFFTGNDCQARLDQVITRTWTAEQHRVQARRLLSRNGADTANRLAAAQVHATLALSLVDPFDEGAS
jgi:hypothetical protein